MKRVITLTGLAMAIGLSSMGAQAADYVAGKDYRVIDNPETISGDAIIVREFFWYGCPHCNALNPHMEKWAKTKDKDVAFFKTPAALNPVWEANARGFYAAQLLGFESKTHDALFNAVHKDGKKLFDQSSLSKWYATKGVNEKKFNSLYNSFAVGTKIGRSQEGAKRYQITGVPSVVVQGKYVVTGEDAKVVKVVDYLVDKVRAEKK
ncbi:MULTISPECIES: thiol:disulfide interchange protein DsbA/DsbL [unclassified Psychrobacter]|uniref:thiol:disulfide interchange protein DsbA/DsbL n=1 Tax=unclassified Psychrobacter TaxID=196806 RepID=UPI00188794FB|nr:MULTISPECIES: thiol:disulfide interchange protein DsbA/DsbL [unclassified Psychrobacter]MBF2718990.1 thiol:disulfide interchange protein DsbA/DsbL [Psychrobacter sp. NG254]MBH0005376.1 thiol:disulfide interchange protein DsbA/DsbL [Psychrobacter sp. SWN149]MBI0425855.1 thiol:disulfide interchange protein DsbA/DsbL [Psychrobacter sp. NG27]